MQTHHTYRVSPWRRRLLYGVWALFALPLAAGGVVTGETALLLTAAIVTAITLPIFVWAVQRARLTLTPGGVELRQAGGRLSTTWANVETVHMVPRAEGFVLREPMPGGAAERYADAAQLVVRGAPLYDPWRRQLLAERRFIPIDAFAYWFTHGDLRPVIESYAPGLVALGEADAAGRAQNTPRISTPRILLISGIVITAGTTGILAASRPDFAPVLTRVVLMVLGLAMAILSVGNFVSATSLFRRQRHGIGALWAAMAVVQLLVALACADALLS